MISVVSVVRVARVGKMIVVRAGMTSAANGVNVRIVVRAGMTSAANAGRAGMTSVGSVVSVVRVGMMTVARVAMMTVARAERISAASAVVVQIAGRAGMTSAETAVSVVRVVMMTVVRAVFEMRMRRPRMPLNNAAPRCSRRKVRESTEKISLLLLGKTEMSTSWMKVRFGADDSIKRPGDATAGPLQVVATATADGSRSAATQIVHRSQPRRL
jgi:hypothetical protein